LISLLYLCDILSPPIYYFTLKWKILYLTHRHRRAATEM